MEENKSELEKNARLELHLVAKSGYETSETAQVSPNQWEKILKIVNDREDIELS
jgi:hypothetical protein